MTTCLFFSITEAIPSVSAICADGSHVASDGGHDGSIGVGDHFGAESRISHLARPAPS